MSAAPSVATLFAILLIAAAAFAADESPAPPAPTPPAQAPAPPAPPQQLTPKAQADGILGKRVFGPGGEDMGLVTDVLVDRDGNPMAAVIDFGGFLGVGSRKIAIDWHLMQFHPGDKDRPIILQLEKAKLQAAPEYRPGKAAPIVGPAGVIPPPPETPANSPTPPTAPAPPPSDNNVPK